jgi:protein-S-isoprenylcysteine O-methyltransferase Ste14
MVRWITNSRLRTAFAILLLVGVFLLSSFFAVLGSWGLHQDYSAIPVIIGLVTALLSLIGIIATLVFAWRADRDDRSVR